jgi:hypothetical protein
MKGVCVTCPLLDIRLGYKMMYNDWLGGAIASLP